MLQVLTVSCKLQVAKDVQVEIDDTLKRFAGACNYAAEVGTRERIKNAQRLQRLVYHDLRERFGLSANQACQVCVRVAASLKSGKRKYAFRPTSISLDARLFSLIEADWSVSLRLGRRVRLPLRIGNYQKGLLTGQNPKYAVLKRRRNGTYYLNIALEKPAKAPNQNPRGFLGVDRGRRDIATTSEGESFSGAQITAAREKFSRVRASVQRRATKGAKRLLKRVSGRESRFMSNVNHTISYRLVKQAASSGLSIVLEDLSGIRNRTKARKENRYEAHSWAFHQLEQYIAYKANMAGVPVLRVPSHYTSQTCACCLHIGIRRDKRFECRYCGNAADADVNAAKVIALLGASVNRPEHGLSCSLGREGTVKATPIAARLGA